MAVSRWPDRIISRSLVIGIWCVLAQACAFATGSVTLAWNPSTDASVVGYNLYYGSASGVYTTKVTAGNTTQTVISGLADGATYYFAATAYDSSGVESPFSNEALYSVPNTAAVNPGNNNKHPTLGGIANRSINENAGTQHIKLTGISSGSSTEIQPLTITAASSNPDLIPDPVISYASPNNTGYLAFTPAPNAYGNAKITVTVNDGQTVSNLASQIFYVTVRAKNAPPTLNGLRSLKLYENAGTQTVYLSGISSGAPNEIQPLSIKAASGNPALIPTPVVNYNSGDHTGTLTFTPVPDANGRATIYVTVNDGQPFSNTRTRSLVVTVIAVNDPPTLDPIAPVYLTQNDGVQTVNLTGISSGAANEVQKLTVTAKSGNISLVSGLAVAYTSPGTNGLLSFKPVTNAVGTTTITVTVNDGSKANAYFSQKFDVTVSSNIVVVASVANSARASAKPLPAALPTATLAAAPHNPGEFVVNLSGVKDQQYIIEASTDLVNWTPVYTNTAPFSFTDTQAGHFSQRYYRSVPIVP